MVRFDDKHPYIWSLICCLALLIIAGFSEKQCFAADKIAHLKSAGISKRHNYIDTKPLAANKTALIEKRWGVKLQGIHVTAAGHMLDFRFQVTDSQKAAPLLNIKNKPLVIVEENGIKLEVPNLPRIGTLRQTSKQIKNGMIFTILFANPGKMVTTGHKLTVHIGSFLIEHITVGDILNKQAHSS